MSATDTLIPLARNLTDLLAFLNYVKKFPDVPSNFTNIINHPADYVPPNRGEVPYVIAVVFMTIAFLVVSARLYARAFITTGYLGPDDIVIIPASVCVHFIEIRLTSKVCHSCVYVHHMLGNQESRSRQTLL
jgi:hypothetical protein